MRYTITIAALLAFTLPASATSNYCSGKAEADCGKVAGCSWRTAETWTRQDGKTRNVNAGCKFDAKAAKAALAAMAH